MDDSSVAISVPLDKMLVNDLEERIRPLKFCERTRNILPPDRNLLQTYINDIEKF